MEDVSVKIGLSQDISLLSRWNAVCQPRRLSELTYTVCFRSRILSLDMTDVHSLQSRGITAPSYIAAEFDIKTQSIPHSVEFQRKHLTSPSRQNVCENPITI